MFYAIFLAHLVLDCIIISSQINPSTTAGTIRILDHIQIGSLFPVAMNGDQLTVERSRAAQKHRLINPAPAGRLEGLIPQSVISSRCVEVQVIN